MDFDVRLEAAGALLTATGLGAPSEVLQIMSAVAGIMVCGIAIVKAAIRCVEILHAWVKRKITTEQAVDQLGDVADDLHEVHSDAKKD